MKTTPLKVVNRLMGSEVNLTDRCCGGTLAATRPDISTQVRFRRKDIRKVAAGLREQSPDSEVKILTSCPACLQGLSRYPRRQR